MKRIIILSVLYISIIFFIKVAVVIGQGVDTNVKMGEDTITIVPPLKTDKVEEFTCQELVKYLSKISDKVPDVSNYPGKKTIFLGSLPKDFGKEEKEKLHLQLNSLREDGFILKSYPNSLVIIGQGSRGLLYGVYAYLQRLGVRWYFPGPDNEVIPHGKVKIDGFDIRENPAFLRRGMVVQDYKLPVHEWIDFAAKMRLNTFFLNNQPPVWTGEAGYGYTREGIMPFIEARGMFFEVGGHSLHFLLPRELFNEHREYFRMAGGERTNIANLCPSSKEGLTILKSAVTKMVSADPKVDVYHIWSTDAGSWCECDECRVLTPSEQAMFVNNILAETVFKLKPDAKVSFIAYAETINNPPLKVKPAPGTMLLFAARDRCYTHGFDDDTCPTNRHWRERLNEYHKIYSIGETAIFEYYIDQVNFGNEGPPLLDTIKKDYKFYYNLAVKEVLPLVTTLELLETVLVNAFLCPKVAWNLNVDLDSELRDICEGYFGSSKMFDYFKTRERMFKRRYCKHLGATRKDDEQLFGSGKLEDWLAYKQIVEAGKECKSEIGKERIKKELDALQKFIVPNYSGVMN